MPHKRAKRSVREAEKKNRQTDLAPTPLASEPIPKGIARVLGAEQARANYRKRKAENATKESGTKVKLLPGESLREFNRRVEDAHRPVVRAAMKRKSKEEPKVKGDGKRKREVEDEGEPEPVKEFARYSSSAPKRLNEVAMAPPVLTRGPRGSGVGKSGGSVSLARKVMLEQERVRAVEMYRALKKANSNSE